EVAARGVELGFGLGKCERERLAVKTEQLVTRIDVLTFADSDFNDLAGNVRSDQNLLRTDIGIVGGNIAPAGKIDAQANDENNRRQADEKNRPQTLAPEPGERGPVRFSRLSHSWLIQRLLVVEYYVRWPCADCLSPFRVPSACARWRPSKLR